MSALDVMEAEARALLAVAGWATTRPWEIDVAAIEARAAAATHAARVHRYCRDCGAVDPPEAPHNGLAFHDGCPRPNWLTGGVDAIGTTHGIVAHATVLELLADNAALLAALRTLAAQHAADVAAAVAGERERAVAVCRAVADGWERASVTAKVDTGLALIRAEGATECADAIAAPTGGGE